LEGSFLFFLRLAKAPSPPLPFLFLLDFPDEEKPTFFLFPPFPPLRELLSLSKKRYPFPLPPISPMARLEIRMPPPFSCNIDFLCRALVSPSFSPLHRLEFSFPPFPSPHRGRGRCPPPFSLSRTEPFFWIPFFPTSLEKLVPLFFLFYKFFLPESAPLGLGGDFLFSVDFFSTRGRALPHVSPFFFWLAGASPFFASDS